MVSFVGENFRFVLLVMYIYYTHRYQLFRLGLAKIVQK